MFKNLSIKGLKGIQNLDISDFQRVNLIVGENNCGKSTILEALYMLINPGNILLPLKIHRFRGLFTIDENYWRAFFYNTEIKKNIELSTDLKGSSEKRKLLIKPYIMEITPSKLKKSDVEKNVVNIEGGHSGTVQTMNGLIYDLNITKGIGKKRKTKKYSKPLHIKEDGKIDLSPPKGYKEHLTGAFNSPDVRYADMPTRFNKILINKQVDELIKVLKILEPNLTEINMGANNLLYCDIGLKRQLPMNLLGSGTLQIFSILLALHEYKDGILLIDEIEDGLHYKSQKVLWEVLLKYAKKFNIQVIVSTHSYESIRALSTTYNNLKWNDDSIRLYRIERKDNKHKIVKYDSEALKISLDSEWEVR